MERNTVVFCRIVVATMAVLRNVGALFIGEQRPVNICWTDGEQRKYSSHVSAMYRFYCDAIHGLFNIFCTISHFGVHDDYDQTRDRTAIQTRDIQTDRENN